MTKTTKKMLAADAAMEMHEIAKAAARLQKRAAKVGAKVDFGAHGLSREVFDALDGPVIEWRTNREKPHDLYWSKDVRLVGVKAGWDAYTSEPPVPSTPSVERAVKVIVTPSVHEDVSASLLETRRGEASPPANDAAAGPYGQDADVPASDELPDGGVTADEIAERSADAYAEEHAED